MDIAYCMAMTLTLISLNVYLMLRLGILNVGSMLSIGPLHLIGKVCSLKVVCDLKWFLVYKCIFKYEMYIFERK
jgi:hypothetical protein